MKVCKIKVTVEGNANISYSCTSVYIDHYVRATGKPLNQKAFSYTELIYNHFHSSLSSASSSGNKNILFSFHLAVILSAFFMC